MKRLFVSLYLVVVLALLLIGWSTDKLWRLLQSSSDLEVTQLASLTQLAGLSQDIHHQQEQQRLSELLNMSINSVLFADVAWLAEQVELLRQHQPVLIYDMQDRLLIYLWLPDESSELTAQTPLLQFGPIDIESQDNQTAKALYFMSYLLLALVIGLWSRPLWRDLKTLQRATESFGQGQWQQTPQVSANSVIAPVVDTFKVMSARIGRLVTEQKELTNAVSHELRTPLSRLKFSLALLDDSSDDNAGKNQAIAGMSADVNELEALVDEMLSYSRLESEARQLLLLEVDVGQLLTNLVDKLGINSEKEIVLNAPDTLHWLCDGHFVERAMQNLITNAVRYASQKIEIRAFCQDNLLYLIVADDGDGIDEQAALQVFKPFVRLDKSRTKDNGGFGLGLAIVKRIVDWHQGQVSVGKADIGGAEFKIVLPKVSL